MQLVIICLEIFQYFLKIYISSKSLMFKWISEFVAITKYTNKPVEISQLRIPSLRI